MSGGKDLGTVMAETAIEGFAQYVDVHGCEMADRYEEATRKLEDAVVAEVGPALADARDAFEVGMAGVAQATFLLSAKIVGINVAKEMFES